MGPKCLCLICPFLSTTNVSGKPYTPQWILTTPSGSPIIALNGSPNLDRNFIRSSGWSFLLIPKTSRSLSFESFCNWGCSTLHGGHQDAKKLTTLTLSSRRSVVVSNFFFEGIMRPMTTA